MARGSYGYDGAASVPELYTGECAVLVHGIRHQCVGADVVIVPKSRVGKGCVIGAGIDGNVTRAHDAPAPLSLHPAKGGTHAWHRVRHAAGVRHTVETVARRYGADFYRLEQNVVARIARHLKVPRACFTRVYIPVAPTRKSIFDATMVGLSGPTTLSCAAAR